MRAFLAESFSFVGCYKRKDFELEKALWPKTVTQEREREALEPLLSSSRTADIKKTIFGSDSLSIFASLQCRGGVYTVKRTEEEEFNKNL